MYITKENFDLFLVPFLFVVVCVLFAWFALFSDHANAKEKYYKDERNFCLQFRDTPQKDVPVRCIQYLKYE